MSAPAVLWDFMLRASILAAFVLFQGGCPAAQSTPQTGTHSEDMAATEDLAAELDGRPASDLLPAADMLGKPLWPKHFFGPQNSLSHSRGVAVDGAGNVLFVGMFHGPTDFGGGPVQTRLDGYNGILASYEPTGVFKWARPFSPGEVWMLGVSASARGDVAVMGEGYGVDVGGPALLTRNFVAVYDSLGAHRWSRSLDDLPGTVYAFSLALDSRGNLYVARITYNASLYGLWLSKFDAAGGAVWTKLYTIGDDTGFPMPPGGAFPSAQLTLDRTGNVILAGTFSGAQDLGGGLVDSAPAVRSPFVIKLDESGGRVFTATRAGVDIDVTAVATDGSSDVLVLLGRAQIWRLRSDGTFVSVRDHLADGFQYIDSVVGCGTDYFLGGGYYGSGKSAIVVSRHDGSGAPRWVRKYVGPMGDDGLGRGLYQMALAPGGDLILTGDFQRSLVFEGVEIMQVGNRLDMYVARVSP